MRVLHLPVNIASQISVTVRALRAQGIDAEGFVLSGSPIQDHTGLRVRQAASPIGWSPARLATRLGHCAEVLALIARADVVHWHFAATVCPWSLDLRWARSLGRPQFIEFWGSDIRDPDQECLDNPFFAEVRATQEYRDMESAALSTARQRRFASFGATALAAIGVAEFLRPGLFTRTAMTRQRVDLVKYRPAYPSRDERTPLVVHSPTAPVIKGTEAVLAAVRSLEARRPLRFQLIQNMPHAQATAAVADCDIFVDQLRLGSHGLAAVEAMAMGKPVVCYIKPSARAAYPEDLPLVHATVETLPDVLERLAGDADLRHELGRQGRAYVKRYHDAEVVARELAGLYRTAQAEQW